MQILMVVPTNRSMEDASIDALDICGEWGDDAGWQNGGEIKCDAIVPFPLWGMHAAFHAGKFRVTPVGFEDSDLMIVCFCGYDFTMDTKVGKEIMAYVDEYLMEFYGVVPNEKHVFGSGHIAPVGQYFVYRDCCKHTEFIDSCIGKPLPEAMQMAF